MAGLGKQNRTKGIKHAVDMSGSDVEDAETEPDWVRPPDDECENHTYTLQVSDRDLSEHRLKVRMFQHRWTWELVEFAIVYQTNVAGVWTDVAELDSCHDVDVHMHRYSRRTRERVEGDPEKLFDVHTLCLLYTSDAADE